MKNCEHCRDSKYVLDYWLEKYLGKQGIHMTDLPTVVFEQIPVEAFTPCHCTVLVLSPNRMRKTDCYECDGTTWKFTEEGARRFGLTARISDLLPHRISELTCEVVERCSCDFDEQAPRFPQRKMVEEIMRLLGNAFPRLDWNIGFSLRAG